MKNMTLPVAVVVAIVGCVLAVSANVTTSNIHKKLEKEVYARLMKEEQLQAANEEIRKLKAELGQTQNKISGIEQILNAGKTAEENLKAQLNSIKSERDKLMQEIAKVKQQAAETMEAQ